MDIRAVMNQAGDDKRQQEAAISRDQAATCQDGVNQQVCVASEEHAEHLVPGDAADRWKRLIRIGLYGDSQ